MIGKKRNLIQSMTTFTSCFVFLEIQRIQNESSLKKNKPVMMSHLISVMYVSDRQIELFNSFLTAQLRQYNAVLLQRVLLVEKQSPRPQLYSIKLVKFA